MQFKQRVNEDPPRTEQVSSLIETQTQGPDAPAVAYLAVSNLCHLQGDEQPFRVKLENTLKKAPQLSDTANNLAWVLAHDKQNLDLSRALVLAKDLLKQHPDKPKYRETYGTILL
ncbi:MAG: hypothetical protein P8J33_07025 [Pirellulaceae bacterium]|nr:hypothetical protein [Pirellulaceae bacterium]